MFSSGYYNDVYTLLLAINVCGSNLEFSVLTRNLLRWVPNEIHNIRRPSEALPSQVFQVVAKTNRRAKGTFFFRTDHKGHISGYLAQA